MNIASPLAKMVMPSPDTCWLNPRLTARKDMIRARMIPLRAAMTTPNQRLPVASVARKPVAAPNSMVPSIPRLRTPARSEMISPSVASIIGVDMRKVAAKRPVMNESESIWDIMSWSTLFDIP